MSASLWWSPIKWGLPLPLALGTPGYRGVLRTPGGATPQSGVPPTSVYIYNLSPPIPQYPRGNFFERW